MVEGIACALGPFLGSIIYGQLGYINTFYFFTAYIALFGFCSINMIPARVNNMIVEESEENEKEYVDSIQITYCEILSNRKSVSALVACTFGMICCMFIDPILSVRLEKMKMKETGIGFEFAVMGISWGFGA